MTPPPARSKLQFAIISYFWWNPHHGPLNDHERKVQEGYGQGEQMPRLPNDLFGSCNIWCFHPNPNGNGNSPQMAQIKRPIWRGCLQSDEWKYWGSQTVATDESHYTSRAEGARAGISVTKTLWGLLWQGRATGRNTTGKREESKKEIPSLLSAHPLVSCWCLPLAQPNQKPRGKGVQVIQSAADSLQVQSKAGKDRQWAWGCSGMVQTEKKQYIWLFTGLQLYILSAWVGDSFHKNVSLVNIPTSDAHIKYWCKNGSGLNTHQCFLICL